MLLYAALYVRLIRANVMETMNEDYVRTARAKGASETRVMVHHVLRNSLLPVVTIFGMDLGIALGGAVFTEGVFGLPGIGHEIIAAYNGADLPVITGIVVFATLCVIVFNLSSTSPTASSIRGSDRERVDERASGVFTGWSRPTQARRRASGRPASRSA